MLVSYDWNCTSSAYKFNLIYFIIIILLKDSGEIKKEKFITVLGTTRAQNIQIEVKRLPAARHIRNAILNMDKMFFNKEMIEVTLINNNNINNYVLYMYNVVIFVCLCFPLLI